MLTTHVPRATGVLRLRPFSATPRDGVPLDDPLRHVSWLPPHAKQPLQQPTFVNGEHASADTGHSFNLEQTEIKEC